MYCIGIMHRDKAQIFRKYNIVIQSKGFRAGLPQKQILGQELAHSWFMKEVLPWETNKGVG